MPANDSFISFRTLLLPSAVLAVAYGLTRIVSRNQRHARATQVRGPPRTSFLWGCWSEVSELNDSASFYEKCHDEYGPVVDVPMPLGIKRIMLLDPKAIASFYAKDTYEYVSPGISKAVIERMTGRGLLWAEGDSHKRQRKTMTPGFSNAAIRDITPVFFDSAYKLKTAWDAMIESDASIIDVQAWMNKVSLDSIGIAGFSHEFHALEGQRSVVSDVFDAFNNAKMSAVGLAVFLLSIVFPLLSNLPTERTQLFRSQNRACGIMAEELLERTKRDGAGDASSGDRSAMALLLKAEKATSGLQLSKEEVVSQIKILLLAGYETTSISLTWSLIELARNPDAQARLREELQTAFPNSDPTWEQLTHGLPYLDNVVHETLRLHPALGDHWRQAGVDDVLPLGTPLRTKTGETVDRLLVAKGTMVTVPIEYMNRAPALWGADAAQFKPERWRDGGAQLPERAREVQGHRHLLTFVDGPRTCLGKNFALTEFKAVLSVLIRNYAFELRDGPKTKIGRHQSVLIRPKVEGEIGSAVPMIVQRLE